MLAHLKTGKHTSKSRTGLKDRFNFCSLGDPPAPNPNFQTGFCFGAFVQSQRLKNQQTNQWRSRFYQCGLQNCLFFHFLGKYLKTFIMIPQNMGKGGEFCENKTFPSCGVLSYRCNFLECFTFISLISPGKRGCDIKFL